MSTNAEDLLVEVFQLTKDCRYLAAFQKYEELLTNQETKELIENASEETKAKINTLVTRAEEIKRALHYEDEGDDWILGNTMFGINTFYRMGTDGNMKIKLEGLMEDLPLFEQIAVIYEIELFKEWVPFCQASDMVEKIDRTELLLYLCLGFSMMVTRDFGMFAYGADCLEEKERILIIGKSVTEYENKPIPFQPTGWFHDRMVIKELCTNIHVLSPTVAKTVIITEINPNAPVPQVFLNYLLKNVAGIMLYVFQQQVMKITKDAHSHHAQRIRENIPFYKDWLLPRVRRYCDLRGWEQPTIVSLGDDGIPPSKTTETTTSTTATSIEEVEVLID